MKRLRVLVPIGLILFYAGILLAGVYVVPWIDPSGQQQPTAWQTWAVIVGGAVVVWYTWATTELRRAAEQQIAATHRQTEVQLRPFVLLRDADAKDEFDIRNVGHGVALRVHVDEVAVGDWALGGAVHSFSLRFPEIAILLPGQTLTMTSEALMDGQPTNAPLSAHLDPRFTTSDVTLRLRYANVEGREYTSEQQISPGKLVLLGLR